MYPIKDSWFCYPFWKKCTTVCWNCNVWWTFLATNFPTNWVFLQKGCCSWIVHPQSPKRWKIVSTWWLEEQIKKEKNFIKKTLKNTLHKKTLLCIWISAYWWVRRCKLLEIFYVLWQSYEFELNLRVIIKTWMRFLSGGEHRWKCLDLIFWLANAFFSIVNTINLKFFSNQGLTEDSSNILEK